MKKFCAIIPAKKKSKGLKNKNFKIFNKKPLIYWTIQNAIKAKSINKIIITSDNLTLKKKYKNEKIFFFHRSKKLCQDKTSMHNVILNLLDKLKKNIYCYDYLVILQPTSPLRSAEDIDKACKIIEKNKYDSLVSVTNIPHNFNPNSIYQKKGNKLVRTSRDKEVNIRQKKKKFYGRNGAAIYITKTEKIKKYILGGTIGCYEMPNHLSVDIDNIYDFKLAELIHKNLNVFRFNS